MKKFIGFLVILFFLSLGLSYLQIFLSSEMGVSDSEAAIEVYETLNEECSESKAALGECYKGKLDKLIDQEIDIKEKWEEYDGLKNWIFAFIRLFVINILTALFFTMVFAKKSLIKIPKLFSSFISFIVIIIAYYLINLLFNTDINGSVFNTFPKNIYEILLLLITLVTAITSAYFTSIGDELNHRFLPSFVLGHIVKKSDTENINKENKYVHIFIGVLFWGLVLGTMYFKIVASAKVDASTKLSVFWNTFFEIVLNFSPSVFIIITVLIMQIYNHHYHMYEDKKKSGRKMLKSIGTYLVLISVFFLIYIFFELGKYEGNAGGYAYLAAVFYSGSLLFGGMGLAYFDYKARMWEPVQYALKASALPIGGINRFKIYLMKLFDVSINPIIQGLLDITNESNVNYKVFLLLDLQRSIAIEIVKYLENYFISQEKFNTGKFIAGYNDLIQKIDSTIQQIQSSNEDYTLKAIASAQQLKVLTKELFDSL